MVIANQFFSLSLVGVENSSRDHVLTSIGNEITTLHPKDIRVVDHLTPEENHAFKILMVQNNVTFVFKISKLAHVLTVAEGIGKGSVSLDVVGSNGKFKIYAENSATISIEDVSDAFVLKYKGESTRFYRFVVCNDNINVKPHN